MRNQYDERNTGTRSRQSYRDDNRDGRDRGGYGGNGNNGGRRSSRGSSQMQDRDQQGHFTGEYGGSSRSQNDNYQNDDYRHSSRSGNGRSQSRSNYDNDRGYGNMNDYRDSGNGRRSSHYRERDEQGQFTTDRSGSQRNGRSFQDQDNDRGYSNARPQTWNRNEEDYRDNEFDDYRGPSRANSGGYENEDDFERDDSHGYPSARYQEEEPDTEDFITGGNMGRYGSQDYRQQQIHGNQYNQRSRSTQSSRYNEDDDRGYSSSGNGRQGSGRSQYSERY